MTTAASIAKALDKDFRTSGDGFAVKCPVHDDSTASLKVSDGKDNKILVHCHAGCDSRQIIAEIDARGLWPKKPESDHKPRRMARPATPAPANDDPAPAKAKVKLVEVCTYDYFDADNGDLRMQVVRFEPKTFRQRRPDPNAPSGWSWSVAAEHRTLYNAPRVKQHDKVVFVVEGEKDVDNLAELGIVATCNPGGAGKWDDRYSELLRGKDVVLVPDNDPQAINKRTGELMWHDDGRPRHPGQDHMDLVGAALQGIATRVRVLHLPDLPIKCDISDWLEAGGDRKTLSALVKDAPEWSPPVPPMRAQALENTSKAVEHPPALAKRARDTSHDTVLSDAPFTPLGYNKGTYYYMGRGTQQITELSPGAHTQANLLVLAQLAYWTLYYESTGKGPFDMARAVDDMIQACHRKGIFSMELLRGRGAWWDDGRIILHCGDRVYVDRLPHSPSAVPSRFVYELGLPMRADIDHPLTVTDARRFLDLVKMMPWAREIDALYVAGWCALAHIGGVLNWRPHIWVVGAKGSGKSHVMSALVKPILGESCLFVASETTEAGIRQSLGSDAIPVLFDEAEGEDQRAHDRLQRILALVRQSSSETGAKLVKGTTGGSAMSFQIRSCFAFSSINAALVQQSDRSRITVVELKKEKQHVDFDDILAAEAALINEGFVSRFHARAIAQAAVIRENAVVFTKVVATLFNEQRAGDQLGTLLAGAWSLTADHAVTFDEAKAWVAKHDWTDDKAEVEGMSDEKALLQFILQSKQRVTLNERNVEVTVGELVQYCTDAGDTTGLEGTRADDAYHALTRIGMRLDGVKGGIYIANANKGLAEILKGSQWSTNWGKVLKRLPGAEAAGSIYFGFPGSESRATWIPRGFGRI